MIAKYEFTKSANIQDYTRDDLFFLLLFQFEQRKFLTLFLVS